MSFFSPITECIQFLNNPKRECRTPAVESPFLYIHTLFVTIFLLNVVSMSLISNIIDFENLEGGFDDLQSKLGMVWMTVMAVLIAPIFEELVFRYPLKHKLFLTMLLTLIDMFLVYAFLQWLGFIKLAIILPFIVGILSLILLAQSLNLQNEWDEKIDAMFPIFFFVVASIFAFVHFFNYTSDSFPWYYTPLLVMPQLLLGLVLGFVRLRIGIWAAIYMHALNNSIPMLALILYGDQLSKM